jgi:GLPGLI family protein
MKYKILYISLLTLLALFFMLLGCNTFTTSKISEGTIEYAVSYPPTNKDVFMTSMLPAIIKYNFKNNEASVDLEISMGIVTTSLIANFEKKQVVQTLSVMGKKFAVVLDTLGIEKLLAKEPKNKIVFLNESKMIAGYTCQKAHIDYEADSIPDFDVYYTNDIDIRNPNWSSPFREIKGVLMEFRIKKYGVEMILTAKNVIKNEIKDGHFSITKDYNIISMEEMDKMFNDMN